MTNRWVTPLLLAALMSARPPQAVAQQILLDKPVKAGELTLFPDLNDTLAYYYVPDQARLATDSNGQPEFSFLRYVENQRSGPDQPEIREGEGGGIVHAVVALSVTADQLKDARTELRRVVPGARIVGPVVYHSGKFGLVTSFKDPQGNLAKQVVGLGSAPLLDGEKAAVSIQLTKLGAVLLWESFHTTAPDISFTFEMEMAGYRSPHRAVIDADFDQIYEHEAFAAGFASTYLAAEIKGAFDDLRRKGVIKLSEVGSDEKLDQLVTIAYNKIADIMFQPMNGPAAPDLAGAAAGAQQNLLDRATTMLDKNQKDARDRNAAADRAATPTGPTPAATAPAAGAAAGTVAAGSVTPPAAGPAAAALAAGSAASATAAGHAPSGPAQPWSAAPRTTPGSHADVAKPTDPPSKGSSPKGQETVPSFAVVATFEMKRVHQQGTFHIDLNKYTDDKLTLRFDQNIGDLSQLTTDPHHFRQINTADPLYQQRELVVFLDGLNATDFGQYVNFVTVRLRKQHADGSLSNDEVRIDRNNFNKAGNAFKLLYGWQGDTDRSRWMDYDYQETWSFFGGKTVEDTLRHGTAGAIAVTAPYQRRVVELQADSAALATAAVRSITAKVYYDLGGSEQSKQITLNATKGQLSSQFEFMLPANQYNYGYEVTWRLKGGAARSSGRQTSNEAVLFVDNVPPTP